MPTDDRVGPDNGYGVKDARVAMIEPDEHGSVDPTQMHSTRHALLQDVELMSQCQHFGFQPPSRLKAIAQHADEEEGNCDHQPQSCSDSVAVVTPADKVFGSDRKQLWSPVG